MGGTNTWRGVTVCACMPAMLDSLAKGTPTTPTLTPTQGSYSTSVAASAQTHAGGGAIDLAVHGWTAEQIWTALVEARRRGLVLSHRTAAQGFSPHMHGVMAGCPHLSGLAHPVTGTAAWQVQEYLAGRNGLAGRGADDGPRDYVGATWWTYSTPTRRGVLVKAGATLTAIAAALGIGLPALLGANPQITDPSVIMPGQTVNVPDGVVIPPVLTPVPGAPVTPSAPVPAPAPAPAPKPAAPRATTARAVALLRYAAAHPGTNRALVRSYQQALREFLGRNTARRLNPAGATGRYGTQTRALTRAAYRKLGLPVSSTPGPVLLARMGIRA